MDFDKKNALLVALIVVSLAVTLYELVSFLKTIYTPEIMLSVLLVFGVIALVLTLSFAAFVFSVLNLSDPTQSLGLPEGSIRSVIALSLILIFMMSSLFLYQDVSNEKEINVYTSITQEQLNDIPKGEIAYIHRVGKLDNETLFDVGRTVEKSKTSEDIAKQIITTVSTLVVAVAGFYFGSKAVSEAKAPPTSVPIIRDIDPKEGQKENK
jgi:hypothetical protein